MDFTSLYYQNPYCKEFEAEVGQVLAHKNAGLYEVTLSETAFYPEGGGQPGDRGLLLLVSKDDSGQLATNPNQVFEVLDTYYKGEEEVHLVKMDQPLKPGDRVIGRIDFERRFDLMQQHTGEHLISGLAKQFYDITNVGFNINETEMTLDFDKELSPEDIVRLELAVNEAVFQNLPVEILYPQENEISQIDYRYKKEIAGQIRLIHVPGVDTCACCGTHLQRTGEIGLVKIVDRINYKGGVRLTALCGRRALADYSRLQDQAVNISQAYSLQSRSLMPDVLRPLDLIEDLEDKVKWRQRQILDLVRAGFRPETLVWFDDILDKNSQKAMAKWSSDHGIGLNLFFSPIGDQAYRYVFSSQKEDLANLHEKFKINFQPKGGGKGTFFQGQVEAREEDLLALFQNLMEDIYILRTYREDD